MRFYKTLILSTSMLASIAVAEANQPTTVAASVEKIFTVRGFDDNDFVEVVAYGKLPSTCYKIADASGSFDATTKEVMVKVNALKYDQQNCAQVLVPYFKVIKLGIMPDGIYDVIAAENNLPATSFKVSPSTSPQQDDQLYAPVSGVFVTPRKPKGANYKGALIRLKGKFPLMLHGCMVLKEVKNYYTPEKVAVILPVAEIREGSACNSAKREFDVQHNLPYSVQTPTLVHVRVMNGDAINQIIE